MFLFIPQCSAQQHSNIYDFKCTATERKYTFRFLLRRLLFVASANNDDAAAAVVDITSCNSYFKHVCRLQYVSVCVFYLVVCVCFVLFLVVLCSQFAYLSADLLIISKFTHIRRCTYIVHAYIEERKRKLSEALTCHPQTKKMLILWIRWTNYKEKKYALLISQLNVSFRCSLFVGCFFW